MHKRFVISFVIVLLFLFLGQGALGCVGKIGAQESLPVSSEVEEVLPQFESEVWFDISKSVNGGSFVITAQAVNLQGVSYSGTPVKAPELVDEVWILEVSSDVAQYKNTSISFSFATDEGKETVSYTLLPVVPDKKNQISFPRDVLKSGELWILDLGDGQRRDAEKQVPEAVPLSEQKLYPSGVIPKVPPVVTRSAEDELVSAVVLNRFVVMEENSAFQILGDGSFAIGCSDSGEMSAGIRLEAGSVFSAKVLNFYNGAAAGKKAQVTSLVEIDGGSFCVEAQSFYNGYVVREGGAGASVSLASGEACVSVAEVFYNGGSERDGGGMGSLYVSPEGQFFVECGIRSLVFTDYKSLSLAGFPFFANADGEIGRGSVYLQWAQDTAGYGESVTINARVGDVLASVLPAAILADGREMSVNWEVADRTIAAVGEYEFWGTLSAVNAESIRVRAVVTADKRLWEPPSLPRVKDILENKVVLYPMNGCEFSIDNGTTWTSRDNFDGLEPGTKYAIIARYSENDDSYASLPSSPLMITTAVALKNGDQDSCRVSFRSSDGQALRPNRPILVTFYADGMGLSAPNIGDRAFFPVSWRIGRGMPLKDIPPYAVQLSVNLAGTYAVTMVYEERVFEENGWQSTGTRIEKETAFVVSSANR